MERLHKLQTSRRAIIRTLATMWLASLITVAHAEEATVQAMKSRIEGFYALQDWHRNGEVVHPPLVDGRLVLFNGRIMYIFHDREQETNKRTMAGYGTYVLEP